MTLFLGLDIGTQGTKALLLDASSREVVARAAQSYGLLDGLPPGSAEQDPRTWIDAVHAVTQEVLGATGVAPADIAAVGVSGQQHGLVVLDEAHEVIRPAKLWCDTSTAREARTLSERLGRLIPTGFTASKVRWLAEHEPDAWARTRHVLLPHDYVNFVLTGRLSTEAGDASGTGFFDVERRAFDRSVMDVIDPRLAECVPPLLQPGEPAGDVSAGAAKRFGLAAGTLVAAGGGDNMMSAVGSGATEPGVVVVSLGTSGTVFTWSPEPVVDPQGLIAPFCASTGGWLPLLCVMNLTGVTEEVRAAFPQHDLEMLSLAAADVPAGCEGLLLLPYLNGERVPDLPEATGALLGLRPGLLRAGHLFRAALEGTSFNLALGVDRLRALGAQVNDLRLVGGGAANPLWRSILADVMGVPVRRLVEMESGALGAALCACWTWTRAHGQDVSAHEVAAPYVALHDEVVEPDVARGRVYAEAKQRLEEKTVQLFG
jgi:xylulokinase